ncbi:hypothetical protein PRUPE_1G452400 [Prunus persica]|uniref:Uncharacterized protein n=1 Tax=Prunus persica TaxID=3760 RepID=A0A251RD67_PRUPE|nr:hypothetical protein PRUPE_1G452400 [Prunus persica]
MVKSERSNKAAKEKQNVKNGTNSLSDWFANSRVSQNPASCLNQLALENCVPEREKNVGLELDIFYVFFLD